MLFLILLNAIKGQPHYEWVLPPTSPQVPRLLTAIRSQVLDLQGFPAIAPVKKPQRKRYSLKRSCCLWRYAELRFSSPACSALHPPNRQKAKPFG
jgi:hypothetical protein